MSKSSRNTKFCRKKRASGSWEDLTKLITCQNIPGTQILPKTERLQQPGSPRQAYNMSYPPRSVTFAKQKAPVAAGKTSPSLNTCHKILGTSFLKQTKKAPAAAGKTSPSLIHITESPEHLFLPKPRCLRQPDFTRLRFTNRFGYLGDCQTLRWPI